MNRDRDVSRWVVGVDGSAGADRALDWCCALMPGRATAIHLIRAVDAPESVGDLEFGDAHPDLDELSARCSAAGIALTSSTRRGRTSSVILDATEDADLLVLGTRGLGGFGPLLLGSVSHQCATHARIPVAIVPAAAAVERGLERVVVGVDGSAAADAALRWVARFAPAGATIHVVGAWQPSSWDANIGIYAQAADFDAARVRFDTYVDILETSVPTLTVRRAFAGGHAADVLIGAATGADLLVVGERGRRRVDAPLLGSTATEVLHRAELVTVVVPADSPVG